MGVRFLSLLFQNLFIFMKLNFEYNKLHLKEITVLMPKYHPSINSFLTPLLGLYGINIKEFVSDFEEKTRFIDFDVVIPLRVRISKIKTFEIIIKTPYISHVLQNIQLFTLLQLYKMYLLKSTNVNSLLTNRFSRNSFLNLREYASILNKELYIPKKIVNDYSKIENVYKRGIVTKFFKNRSQNGITLIFNNSSGQYLNQIRKAIDHYGAKLSKINNKNLNNNYANSFYISIFSADSLVSLTSYFLKLKNFSNFYVSSFSINDHIISKSFVKTFIKELISFEKNQIIYSIKRIFQIVRFINFNNTKLNRIIANIPSVN